MLFQVLFLQAHVIDHGHDAIHGLGDIHSVVQLSIVIYKTA